MWRVEFLDRTNNTTEWRCYKYHTEDMIRAMAKRKNWLILTMTKEY